MKKTNLINLCILSSFVLASCSISSIDDVNKDETKETKQDNKEEQGQDSKEETKPDSESNPEPKIEHIHDFTYKNTADRYLAKKGTYLSKREYYYSCKECGKKSNKTFAYGHSDYLYSEAIDSCYADDPFKADLYKIALKKTIETLDTINDETDIEDNKLTVEWFNGDKTYTEESSKINRTEARNISRIAASSGETHPEIYSNLYIFSCRTSSIYGSDAVEGLNLVSVDGYDKASQRSGEKGRGCLTALHEYVDPLIREDATEVEKALFIHLAMQNYWSVGKYNLFYSALNDKAGTVFTWSQLFEHLAHRYNLDSFFVTPLEYNQNSGNDFWNTINIDGNWYLIDTCKDKREQTSLEWFCTDDTNHTKAKYIQAEAKLNSPINRKLIQLYENEELAGVFYNLDTALDNISDKESNYKLILGIGESGIRGFTFDKAYFENEYETNKTSCTYNTLSIESCCDTELSLKAPSEFFNQKGLTLNKVIQSTI